MSDNYSADNKPQYYEHFLEAYPDYKDTTLLDDWRSSEYSRLDTNRAVYLDYTGGGLYGETQLKQHFAFLRHQVLGNPHSVNPSSQASTERVEDTRRYILDYFNASAKDYVLVFTANATGALKLIGESYPFQKHGRFLLTFDNHNSVNGIREYAHHNGASVSYVPLSTPELRIEQRTLLTELENLDSTADNLFAFPAQSNFSGVKHPLELIQIAQDRGWDVLLDAAAYVPTNQLDLGEIQPDFVTLSFYKMFGYPTGLGALLIHRRAYAKLRRPWFAGGTVNFASVQANGFHLAPGEVAFEDGTINYLAIPAIKTGLEHLEKAGMDMIGRRIQCLTGWLLTNLLSLRHENGAPLVRLYGPSNTESRGGTITLNFYDPEKRLLDYRRIEELASEEGISLRTGCFCNPGAGEIAEGLTADEMRAGLKESENITLPRFVQLIQSHDNKSAGAIRISLGIASNFSDAYQFMRFAAGFINKTNLNLGEASFDIAACRAIRDVT